MDLDWCCHHTGDPSHPTHTKHVTVNGLPMIVWVSTYNDCMDTVAKISDCLDMNMLLRQM